MSIGIFTEKKRQPSPDEITAALGPARPAWDELVQFIRSSYSVEETWKFMYGKKYGWALHVERERKMLVNLYPNQDGFTVQINLPESAVQAALALDLPAHLRDAITGAFPFPEGRWIFLPYREQTDVAGFKNLLALRVASRLDKKGK